VWARLCAAAADRKAAVAVGREGLSWSFDELVQRAELVAGRLADAPATRRVGAALPSGPEFTALQLGCMRAGVLFVPLPHDVTAREAGHYLDLAAVDLLVVAGADSVMGVSAGSGVTFTDLCEGRYTPGVGGARQDFTDGIRQLQFTTGSTGLPQAALLTEQNLLASVQSASVYLRPDRPVYCPLPQFHAMGGAVAIESLCHGSAVLFANRFDPAECLQRLAGCRRLAASPNFVAMLLRLGALSRGDQPQLEEIMLGTAPVSRGLVADLRAAFPDALIRLRYGLAEAVGALTLLTLGPGEILQRDGDVGPPVDGVELEVRDGELWARGPAVAATVLGVEGPRALLDSDGFLRTGDEAALIDGHVHLGGRRSTLLKVHGYRVDPAEIEAVLREVEGVAEVVVLGVPDEVAGQRVVACVEPEAGGSISDDLLRGACRESLSPHKQPARIAQWDVLPRTPAGKPDRAALQAQVETPSAG